MKLAAARKPVSREVRNRLKDFENYLTALVSRQPTAISIPCLPAVKAGGKRLRPALVIIAAGLSRLVDKNRLFKACAAVELVHLASLVHDDILDNAETRRGMLTINANYGIDRAICAGDFLFGLAFRLLSDSDDNTLSQPLARASLLLSAGELQQRQTLRRLDQSVSGYLERISTKTAALFVASAVMGARLAGAGKEVESALETYSGNLGAAFQIYDDILDFTSDEATLGKPVGNDIREGTVTLPMIFALEYPDNPLAAALSAPVHEAVAEAVAFVNACGAIERAKNMAADLIAQAKHAAAALPSGPTKQDLLSLGNYVIERYN